MSLRMSYWTPRATRPPRYRRTYAKTRAPTASTMSSTSHGHSGDRGTRITLSMIWRSTRGATVWHTLPSTAADNEMKTSRRCRSM